MNVVISQLLPPKRPFVPKLYVVQNSSLLTAEKTWQKKEKQFDGHLQLKRESSWIRADCEMKQQAEKLQGDFFNWFCPKSVRLHSKYL